MLKTILVFDPAKLTKARTNAGWSKRKLTLHLGWGPERLIRLERGDVKSPRVDTLHPIAKALGVEIGDFFNEVAR